MQQVDQHTQQQIADLVEACAGYWELRGIACASNTEMQLELEQHLQQAVRCLVPILWLSLKPGREKCAPVSGEEGP